MIGLWLDSRAPRHDHTMFDHGEEIGAIGTPLASKAGGAGSICKSVMGVSVLGTKPAPGLFDLPCTEAIDTRCSCRLLLSVSPPSLIVRPRPDAIPTAFSVTACSRFVPNPRTSKELSMDMAVCS